MQFSIREAKTDGDMENFFRFSYENVKVNDDILYRNLVKEHPDSSDEEIFQLFKKDTEEYFDFSREDCKVFIAETEEGDYAGHLWVAIRDSEDVWDFERPIWIFDIIVHPNYRRQGLGHILLRKADEFAQKMGRNVGLFVHSHNEAAISLYKSNGYRINTVPISKEPENHDIVLPDEMIFQETSINAQIAALGLGKFTEIVRSYQDISDKRIQEKYQEYLKRYIESDNEHQSFKIVTTNDQLVGYVWVGKAYFNEKIAMIYDFAIEKEFVSERIGENLFNIAENWAKMHEFSRIYILLNALDEISLEECKDMGFKVPGYFMLKILQNGHL